LSAGLSKEIVVPPKKTPRATGVADVDERCSRHQAHRIVSADIARIALCELLAGF
jgi:hypothetical protein